MLAELICAAEQAFPYPYLQRRGSWWNPFSVMHCVIFLQLLLQRVDLQRRAVYIERANSHFLCAYCFVVMRWAESPVLVGQAINHVSRLECIQECLVFTLGTCVRMCLQSLTREVVGGLAEGCFIYFCCAHSAMLLRFNTFDFANTRGRS